VKIIHNAVTGDAVYPTSCQRCQSKLEVAAEDFKRGPSDDRDGQAFIYVCPCCLRENWVDATLIPNGIKLRVSRA
jgi:hypothetical protein